MTTQKKIIVGLTGASGAIYGIKLIHRLNDLGVEVHLIISETAQITIEYETDYLYNNILKSVKNHYNNKDFTAPIASGSFKNDGMIIAPCSIKTMSQIASGNIDSLIARAADVALKERRKLIMMVRESPLHLGHLRNMSLLSEIGAIIAPPLPAMYLLPKSIDDIINNNISRILDLVGVQDENVKRWEGI